MTHGSYYVADSGVAPYHPNSSGLPFGACELSLSEKFWDAGTLKTQESELKAFRLEDAGRQASK